MQVDGINLAGSAAQEGVAREPVVVPVNVESGEEASPRIAEAPIEQGPFPVGAKPIDQVPDGSTEARANVEAAASSETAPAPAVETPEHQDPAQASVEEILREGTPTALEGAVGGPPAGEATSPAQAPEISAFAPKGLDVPPPKTTPDLSTTPDIPASPDFASPYPLPEKPQVTTEPTPVAPQTFIDTSGLPETTPPPVISEPQVPTSATEAAGPTVADKRGELKVQEDGLIDKMAELVKERREASQRIEKPLTDIGSDFARIKEVDAELDRLLKEYQTVRKETKALENPEAKSGEAN